MRPSFMGLFLRGSLPYGVQALDGMVLDASVREGPPDTSMNFYVLVMPGSADVSSVLALDLAGNTLEELPVL